MSRDSPVTRLWRGWPISLVVLAALFASVGAAETLRIENAQKLPVAELSALVLVDDTSGAVRGLAAGDSDFHIVRFEQGAESPHWHLSIKDVGNLLDGKPPSQWEAMARDGAGNICLLAETSSRVDCLIPDLSRRIGSLRLDASSLRDLNKSWQADPNSRGEGMILLKRGHLLLLKEKRPSLLVEFGPAGEAAIGFSPETALGSGESFRLPEAGELDALKLWTFAPSLAASAHDASDLSLGPDRRLYLISDESKMLIRLEGRLKPEESTVRGSAFWKLPHDLEKPEGLAVDQGMHPWIVIDRKASGHPTLFRLSPISSAWIGR